MAEILRQVPVILPPDTAIIRHLVEDFLTSLGLTGLRPAVETVAMTLGRGIFDGVRRGLIHLTRCRVR